MKRIALAMRELRFTYSRGDLIAVALLAGLVSLWAALADDSFSIGVLFACELSFVCFYLVGSLFAGLSCLSRGLLFELPLRLLVGYGVVNTALLLLAWISPLGMAGNFALVVSLAVLMAWWAKRPQRISADPASLWAIGLCAVATTLWCQDCLDPIVENDGVVLFKPWIDGFYHSVHIRIFAASHGASTIEDFRMSGVPARLYHYGVYMLPAFIKQVSALHSYSAFSGVLVPVGVLFTGLAAYSFFGSLWGAWPGLAACMGLLLLPDGFQQGMQNPFLSYQWLTQISPSATYGLALLAVGWLLVIQGTVQGSWPQVVSGWLVATVVVIYKLHYVVASALLLLLVPALFFKTPWGWKKRALWVTAALGFYLLGLLLGQKVPGVPLIRFDGSSIGEILHLMTSFAVPGAFRDYLEAHVGRTLPVGHNLLLGVPYVLLAALGLLLPLLLGLIVALRRRTNRLYLLFPLLLLTNFLVMFFGLALDFQSSTPDELSHRPVMLVYFFVSAWVGGALGLLLLESRRFNKLARSLLLTFTAVLLVVPASLGEGVQLMWVMPKISPVRLPSSLVRAAEYIREHGGPDEIFQDSQFDRFYAIAALSERRTFVAHTLTNMPFRADMVATRSAAVDRIMWLNQPKMVVGTARTFGIRWFVRQRGNRVNWPPELRDHPAFEAGPFSVYDLRDRRFELRTAPGL